MSNKKQLKSARAYLSSTGGGWKLEVVFDDDTKGELEEGALYPIFEHVVIELKSKNLSSITVDI